MKRRAEDSTMPHLPSFLPKEEFNFYEQIITRIIVCHVKYETRNEKQSNPSHLVGCYPIFPIQKYSNMILLLL